MGSHVMIALVGEQPIPVLLPALALKPHKVLFVSTDWTQVVARRVARLLGAEHEELVLPDPYDMDGIQRRLREKLDLTADLSFNVTGGTKIMVLATFGLVAELGGSAVYYQTEGRKGRAQQSVLHRYSLSRSGAATQHSRQALPPLITLDGYLRAHLDAYQEAGFSWADGGEFERAVHDALTGHVDEVKGGVLPEGVKKQVEIDLLVRCGNQVAMLEVKGGGGDSGKKAVDQLTTAAAREYLGTYTSRFLVIGRPMDPRYKALAAALHVRVIELPGYRGGSKLDERDAQLLRSTLLEYLPRPTPGAPAAPSGSEGPRS